MRTCLQPRLMDTFCQLESWLHFSCCCYWWLFMVLASSEWWVHNCTWAALLPRASPRFSLGNLTYPHVTSITPLSRSFNCNWTHQGLCQLLFTVSTPWTQLPRVLGMPSPVPSPLPCPLVSHIFPHSTAVKNLPSMCSLKIPCDNEGRAIPFLRWQELDNAFISPPICLTFL